MRKNGLEKIIWCGRIRNVEKDLVKDLTRVVFPDAFCIMALSIVITTGAMHIAAEQLAIRSKPSLNRNLFSFLKYGMPGGTCNGPTVFPCCNLVQSPKIWFKTWKSIKGHNMRRIAEKKWKIMYTDLYIWEISFFKSGELWHPSIMRTVKETAWWFNLSLIESPQFAWINLLSHWESTIDSLINILYQLF